MSKPTLTYYDGLGKGEAIRLLLVLNNIEFNDIRITTDELDESLKERLPFGQVPFYEDDEIQLAQSITISRYLATKYNIAGKTVKDRFIADSIVDTVGDFTTPAIQAKTDSEKEKVRSVTIPKYLSKLESLLVKNGGQYFVGDSLTWADIQVFDGFEYLKFLGFSDTLTKYPALNSLSKRITEIPSIKSHIASRKPSTF